MACWYTTSDWWSCNKAEKVCNFKIGQNQAWFLVEWNSRCKCRTLPSMISDVTEEILVDWDSWFRSVQPCIAPEMAAVRVERSKSTLGRLWTAGEWSAQVITIQKWTGNYSEIQVQTSPLGVLQFKPMFAFACFLYLNGMAVSCHFINKKKKSLTKMSG